MQVLPDHLSQEGIMNVMKRNEKRPEVLAENEKIKQNRLKYGTKVHKFKAAHWTHPNGHPRCVLCGQEESISPECNREPTAAEHQAFQEKLSAEFSTNVFDVTDEGDLQPTSRDERVKKAHFDPNEPRDKDGQWVRVPGKRAIKRAVKDMTHDTVPALGRGRAGRKGTGATKVSGKTAAKKKKVGTSPQMKQRSLNEQADAILGVQRRQRATVDSTAASRVKSGTVGDATHNPIKVPSRSQVAAGKQHIKDNVPKKYEAYAGLVHRLASRGRVQSPEARKAAAEKYNYSTDDLFKVEKGVYDAMFGSAHKPKGEHHTITDAPKKVRDELRHAGASHATPDPDGSGWFYQDRNGNWFTSDDEGVSSELTAAEAVKEAVRLAKAWGEVDRANMTDAQKRAREKFLASRAKSRENMAEERALAKAQKEEIANRMKALGLDSTDPIQIRAYLGKIVTDELSGGHKSKGGRKVDLPAADADKKAYQGRKPQKGKDTVVDGGTAAKSPRARRVQKSRIHKHGDPDTTPPAIYHAMHPGGRKTKWVKSAAQVERDHAAGWKFVSGDDGRDLSLRQAKAKVGTGGKPVYAYKPGTGNDSPMNATARDRRKASAVARSGEPKKKITRTRTKSVAPPGFEPIEDHDIVTKTGIRNKYREKFQSAGIPVPPGADRVHVNVNGSNPELWYTYYSATSSNPNKMQSKYSPAWRTMRDGKKFEKLSEVNEKMPLLDKQLKKDSLKDPVAGAVQLMRITGMRVDSGKDEGTDYDAVGVTSLEVQHVSIKGNNVKFTFIGKGGKDVGFEVNDPDLARLMKKWTEGKAPGDLVFPGASDRKTNLYIKTHINIPGATNKDLRTRVGTARAIEKIQQLMKERGMPKSTTEAKRWRKEVAEYASYYLGNTPTVALKSYIDPSVFSVLGI
jgi:DNA topoisomerase IB